MADKDKKKRDPNEPTPKPKASLKARFAKLLLLLALFGTSATMVAYSLKISSWPWAWSQDQWKGYLDFVQLKAKAAGEEIKNVDWSKLGDKTKALWSDAPSVLQRIEDKLGVGKSSKTDGAKPAGDAGSSAAGSGELGAEHKAGLEAMREGITLYRKAPSDPSQFAPAKKKFEEAQDHLAKALKETNDDKQKADMKQEIEDCSKYLEDCRAKEKS